MTFARTCLQNGIMMKNVIKSKMHNFSFSVWLQEMEKSCDISAPH